jgi:hypothetical protein
MGMEEESVACMRSAVCALGESMSGESTEEYMQLVLPCYNHTFHITLPGHKGTVTFNYLWQQV